MSLFRANSWPSIFSIYLFGVCGAFTISKLVPLIEDFQRQFALDPANFGWLIALAALPAAMFAIPSGVVVDRFGPRKVLVCAALLGVLANAIYIQTSSLAAIQLARFIEGVAIVHFYTAGPAFLMTTTVGDRRSRAMSLWATYTPVGTALALFVAGQLAGVDSWKGVFWFHGGLIALAAILVLFQPEVSTSDQPRTRAFADRLADLSAGFGRIPLVALCLGFFLVICLGIGLNVSMPPYLVATHEIPTKLGSTIVATTTLTMLGGSLLVAYLIPRGLNPARLFIGLGLIAFLAGSASYLPGLPLPTRWMTLATWFLFHGAALATILVMLPQVVDPQRPGSGAALLNFSGAVAALTNPPLWLAVLASGQWSFFLCLLGGGFVLAMICVSVARARTGMAGPVATS